MSSNFVLMLLFFYFKCALTLKDSFIIENILNQATLWDNLKKELANGEMVKNLVNSKKNKKIREVS